MVYRGTRLLLGVGRLWRKVQRHARGRGGGWCTGVPGILKGQGGGGCGGRCSTMLEEEGEDGLQGYQAVRGQGGGGCGGRCSAMLEEEGEDGIEGYQALKGAGRRGLWREVQPHARRRGGGWCTGVPGFF